MASQKRLEEFVSLVAKHRGQVLGYIFVLVRNMADAEDIYQQTLLLLWEKFDEYQTDTNFAGWACKSSYFVAMNYLRSHKKSPIVYGEEVMRQLEETQLEIFKEDEAAIARKEALAACLHSLTSSDRKLIRACYYSGKEIKEVAKSRGRTAGGVYTSISRIRKLLYNCIETKLRRMPRA